MLAMNTIARFASSPFAGALEPWQLTSGLHAILQDLLGKLGDDFERSGNIAVHRTARIEPQATLKGPAIIGPGCFVAASAYLRDGVYLEQDCIIGPAAELKTSVVFRGSKLAHLNFVGDSVLGEGVNIEAGAVVANYRNELSEKRIRIAFRGQVFDTGVEKFGALIGDHVRIGANAVIAPGAILEAGAIVPRLTLVDQSAWYQ